MNTDSAGELILVVEDSLTQALRTQFALEASGYRVVIREDGIGTLDYLLEQHPDLILLDMTLPGMGGQEIAMRVKSNPLTNGIPVIFLTGQFNRPQDIVSGLGLGAEDYLIKPVDDEVLVARIKTTLRITRIQRELSRQIRSLVTTVKQVGGQLGGQFDEETLVRFVSQLIFANFDYAEIRVWLIRGELLTLAVMTGSRFESTAESADQVLPAEEDSMLAQLCRQEKTLQCSHGGGSGGKHPTSGIPGIDGPYSAVAVPILSNGESRGVLELVCHSERDVNQEDGLVAQTLSVLIGVSMHNAKLFADMKQLATRDSLTGMLNRRTIMERFREEWARRRRYPGKLGVLTLDIDRFKDINDSYGHAAGDRVLRALAVIFQCSLRDVDMAGRMGGDEFLIILPETSRAGAIITAERLVAECRKLTIELKDSVLSGISMSIGVTGFPECNFDGVDDMMQAADEALYRAKAGGRDRVEVF
jgi:two-component system cell cycle response regulator